MTTAGEQPPGPPPASGRQPVLLAALLGGLIGGVFSFALARTFPPPVKPAPPAPQSEARQFAEDLFRKLKAGHNDEFVALIRPGFGDLNDEQFTKFREGVFEMRTKVAKAYGPPIEFEFARETPLSPSLVRVTFVEKYPRGCVLWWVVVYNTPAGWQVSAFSYQTSESGFTALQ